MRIVESVSAAPSAPKSTNFTETLMDILDRVEYRRVSPFDLDDPVYRLRYEAYRRENFYPTNSLGVLRDGFDDYERYPNSWTFGVYIDGALVSSLRIHYLTPDLRRSPANSLFGDVLGPLMDQGATFIDPTRFAVDFEASLAYPALPFLTLRIGIMATRHYRATYALHCVRQEHAAFYRRLFQSRLMCEARSWHDVGFPMELWGARAADVYEQTLSRYPFFHSSEEERVRLFESPYQSPLMVRPSPRAPEPRVFGPI